MITYLRCGFRYECLAFALPFCACCCCCTVSSGGGQRRGPGTRGGGGVHGGCRIDAAGAAAGEGRGGRCQAAAGMEDRGVAQLLSWLLHIVRQRGHVYFRTSAAWQQCFAFCIMCTYVRCWFRYECLAFALPFCAGCNCCTVSSGGG